MTGSREGFEALIAEWRRHAKAQDDMAATLIESEAMHALGYAAGLEEAANALEAWQAATQHVLNNEEPTP